MGLLVNGQWSTESYASDDRGRFIRSKTKYRRWITEDATSAFAPERDRYHLYVSYACPWAHRTLIMRKLRGLDDTISLSVVDPFMGEDGWPFSDGPGCIPDTINGAHYLRDIYLKADANYTGRVTVPVLWDRKKETIVNNESREIMRMFDTVFSKLNAEAPDYYPTQHRDCIDKTIDALYDPINNGVYRAGFARKQEAYDQAVGQLFKALDMWEGVLTQQRYLCGNVITEADWCFFTTLIRFDMVYHTHFKCNVRRITDYPNIWNYLRELYQLPGVAQTCHFDHIKQHYYQSHTSINPTGIVAAGPLIDFTEPHDRDRLGQWHESV
ncbi:MAG: glutathione S-transferase family protein [Acidiferrobacterales bacterium]